MTIDVKPKRLEIDKPAHGSSVTVTPAETLLYRLTADVYKRQRNRWSRAVRGRHRALFAKDQNLAGLYYLCYFSQSTHSRRRAAGIVGRSLSD